MAYLDFPYQDLHGGIQTFQGTYVNPAGRVFFVHSSGTAHTTAVDEIKRRIYTTLNSAMGQCTAGAGDTIYVLPGHTESVTAADNFSNAVAGMNVIGVGQGNNRPTFTWTTATSTWLMNDVNVLLANMIFNMDPGSGSVSVAAPMTISVAGCSIVNCRARTSTDANSLATIPLALTDGADQCSLIGNRFFGATAGECTTQVDIAGADDLYMAYNSFHGASSSTGVGIVRFKTTAATNVTLKDNVYVNKKAASAAAVTGVAGVTGTSHNELFAYLDNTSTTMWVTSPGLMHFFNPRTSNLAGEAGMLSTVVST